MTTNVTTDTPMKVLRDSVHGYIQIPKEWCRLFVDTPIFQRLRRIEQTSMRCLYPSARHDRFIHSLGTYYLGSRAIESLFINAVNITNSIQLNPEEIERYKITFRIACLLHDCAHAPFSHTFEHHYDRGRLLDTHLEVVMVDDLDFTEDYEGGFCSPAHHEKASAIILLEHYKAEIEAIGGDPSLAARMIIGCHYHGCGEDNRKRFKNALISLLNSNAIDVDKLDYIIRDTWASGVNNASIDIDRLLASVTVIEHERNYTIAFKKNALSVIQLVVDARNFLHRWIFSHHKVAYNQYLLTKAIEIAAKKIGAIEKDNLTRIFSLETFRSVIDIDRFRFYLVTEATYYICLSIIRMKYRKRMNGFRVSIGM